MKLDKACSLFQKLTNNIMLHNTSSNIDQGSFYGVMIFILKLLLMDNNCSISVIINCKKCKQNNQNRWYKRALSDVIFITFSTFPIIWNVIIPSLLNFSSGTTMNPKRYWNNAETKWRWEGSLLEEEAKRSIWDLPLMATIQ